MTAARTGSPSVDHHGVSPDQPVAFEVNRDVGDVVPELGTFILPGRITDPRPGLQEAIDAERAGFNRIWFSERYDLKEMGVITGAVSALTSRINFASGLLAAGSRHPLMTAAWAATTQALFGNRLTIGIGRGVRDILAPQGMRCLNLRETADYASIVRRLLIGERVSYEGPLGTFPEMCMVDVGHTPPPPLVLGCYGGEKAMDLAVRCFDGVFLHPFLSLDAVAESVRFRDEAALRHDRDPAEVPVIHEIVAAPDLDGDETTAVVHARALTYLMAGDYGKFLMKRNRWDRALLQPVLEHPVFASARSGVTADQAFHRSQLLEAARLLPSRWIEPSAAIGTPAQCVDRLREYLDVGAAEICLHGSSPSQLSPVLDAWRASRAPHRPGGE